MITVLVVDDSAFIRNAFTHMLSAAPEIQVVGVAADGEEAIEQIGKLNPDVVTLDIEMPRLDGLAALQVIMRDMPRPVIMVSSLTQEGAEKTLRAFELGAVDFIPKFEPGKSGMNLQTIERELCAKIKIFGGSARQVKPLVKEAADPGTVITLPRTVRAFRPCVAIGVSTGGPPAMQKLISAFPEDFPAYFLVAQHMPASFTGPFAKRLDGVSKLTVKEAEDGEMPRPGVAYIAPGGRHMQVERHRASLRLTISEEPTAALYKPSANVLFESVGRALGKECVGVIMTGMGSDGCEGMKVLKAGGGRVLAQSEASCVVYGMPRSVVEANLADRVVDLEQMPEAIGDAVCSTDCAGI